MRALRVAVMVCMLCAVNSIAAQEIADTQHSLPKSSSPIDYAEVERQLNRAAQPTFWERFANWFAPRIDKSPDERKIVYDVFLGVGYTQETDLLFLVTGAGRYSLNRKDKSLPHSTTALTGMVSINGLTRLITSSDLALSKKDHLLISLTGGYMPVRFWGLGYEAANRNKVSKYMRSDFRSKVEYRRHIVGGLSAGAGVKFLYISCQDVSELALQYLQSDEAGNLSATTTGIGASIKYDSRYTNEENITQGFFIELGGALHPKALGSHHNTLWHIEATANYHQPLWRGGVLAFDLFADMWSWDTPWQFWAKMGGDNRMRGYYYGRYTDRNMVTAQVELRQRIYGILSGVVWGGAGSVFSKYKYFDIDHLLPNYGVGIRVAVARNLSFRVDYGFGRHSHGLIINVNEAF